MEIIVKLDGDEPAHLLALAALIDSLGGPAATPRFDFAPTPIAAPTPPAAALPTPPAPPAPAVAAPPPPVSNGADNASPEVDSTGLRWDGRIHSTPAKANADGSWRARRGVDDATVTAVTAELRGLPGAPVPPPPAPVATASPAPVATPVAEPSAPPPPPAAPTPVGAKTSPMGRTFQQVMKVATDKGLTYEALNAEYAPLFGVTKINELIQKPSVWDDVVDVFAMLPDAA